jgi:hypothetical protein
MRSPEAASSFSLVAAGFFEVAAGFPKWPQVFNLRNLSPRLGPC